MHGVMQYLTLSLLEKPFAKFLGREFSSPFEFFVSKSESPSSDDYKKQFSIQLVFNFQIIKKK